MIPAGQNFSQYLRALQILFFSLLSGQIFICAAMWFVRKDQTAAPEFQEEIWLQGIGLLSLLLLGGSLLLRKKLLENVRAQATLQGKFAQYRTTNITTWAIMEGGTLVNAVFFFLSGRMEFLYMAGAAIGLFATQIPVRVKIIQELELSAEEERRLDDPDTIVM